jgi:hypothetical protein
MLKIIQERLQRSCGGMQAHLKMGSAAFADSIPLRMPAIRRRHILSDIKIWSVFSGSIQH